MATVPGGSGGYWNSYRTVNTPAGTYRSVYHPGAPNEWVRIFAPGEAYRDIATPALGDWGLVVEDGEIICYYLKIEGNNRVEVRKPTGIVVGEAAPPSPPPTNVATIEAIRELLTQAQALLDTLT